MPAYLLTGPAEADLAQIAHYIAQHNVPAADRLLREFDRSMSALARRPGLGHVRTDLASEELRFWPVASYLVVYRPYTKPLQIIRVLHSARDVRSLLDGPTAAE
jgi:toxin ParE1/3/4